MRYKFALQDPTAPQTTYLYEELVAELDRTSTIACRAIFAFVSENGIAALVEDPALRSFLDRSGRCSLVAGIDAVTDPAALRALLRLAEEHQHVEVRVFHNESRGLFHPKIAHFTRSDGTQVVVVGSGNLTPGGLRGNIEAYSVATYSAAEGVDLGTWDSFLSRHASAIRPIDDEAFEKAETNRRVAFTGPRRRREAEPDAEPEGADVPEEPEAEARRDDRMLIAEVPKAGGRWDQVHFNRDVVREYFRVIPNSEQRVFLREALGPRRLGRVEVRPCVFSRVNRNHRVEFGARRGDAYPDEGPPILVARETGLRSHRYKILFPGEPGYQEMAAFTTSRPSLGRGVRRVLTGRSDVLASWPECYV
jgi:HKD family nuclease